jgi:hypothetical protein
MLKHLALRIDKIDDRVGYVLFEGCEDDELVHLAELFEEGDGEGA